MTDTPLYLDASQSIEARVNDLISRMTLEEKVSQMCNSAPAIPRLGITAYDFWSEALHGVARNGRATVFPQAIGMSASWDRELVHEVANAISDEGRAKHHEAMRRNGKALIYQGLTFWSPNVNIFRDPRWGRGQETWGEDPYLTGELGSEFVWGMQGDDPKYMKTAACAKHYAVHSGPEKDRHTFDAIVSKRDLYDTYLPAFKKLVMDAKVEAVMGAYNRTLGEPCCASRLLIGDILYGEWGFDGHFVSDCGAINDFHTGHFVTKDAAESAALGVKEGCDNSCICTYEHLSEAVERGLLTEEDINKSLFRTLRARFRLGMFDPADQVAYTQIPMSVVNSPKHRKLAYDMACESLVLLKNRNQILPVKDSVKSMLIIGPAATSIECLLGNYHGMSDTLTTIVEGITSAAPEGVKVEFRPGCQFTLPNRNNNNMDWTVHEAAAVDLTIACVGLSPQMEGEEGDAVLSDENGDRTDIKLPAAQSDYIKKLVVQGARVVLVVTGGSPVALGELEDMVEAVLWVWYPGQEGGRAVADTLFGKVNPSGKLPLTFPKSVDQLPPFEDYNMKGRTYRYSEAEPLYPFGFGLSYTQFEYSDLKLEKEIVSASEGAQFTVTVKNAGPVDGDEVVQVYLKDLETSVFAPIHKLVNFQRVSLKAGEQKQISFTIGEEALALVNDDGQWVVEPGQFKVIVGGCSPSKRGLDLGSPEPAEAIFSVK